MEDLVLIFGTNQGERCELLSKALSLISIVGEERCRSYIYESTPWGFDSPSLFYNQVVIYKTNLSPEEVLKLALETENLLGRERLSSQRYSSRTMDIDILFYGNRIVKTPDLEIPHPRLQLRKFVLVPLNELIPNFIHPGFNKSVAELLKACPDDSQVIRILEH